MNKLLIIYKRFQYYAFNVIINNRDYILDFYRFIKIVTNYKAKMIFS